MQKFRCTDIVEKNVIQNLLREKLNQKKRIIHFIFLSFFIIQMKPLLREHPTYRLVRPSRWNSSRKRLEVCARIKVRSRKIIFNAAN